MFEAITLPTLDETTLIIVIAIVAGLSVLGLVIKHRKFIGSLKASVKFEVNDFSKRNQPVSSESDLIDYVMLIVIIVLSLLLFSPALQFDTLTYLGVSAGSVVLMIFGLFGQHMKIGDSYSGKSNVLLVLRTLVTWDLVFLAKRYITPIVFSLEKMNEIKATSLEFSKGSTKISTELAEFWKSPKFYPMLIAKYVDSTRDAVIVVTDIPWKDAVMEKLIPISAGIKTLNISVGVLFASYTPAVEMMSSPEHLKYLKIDKVEVAIFTSMSSTLSAEAQKNLSAAALESMRAGEERSRRMNAEARANKLQRRLDEALKDVQMDKRQGENTQLEGLDVPESKDRIIRIAKRYGLKIALGIAVFSAIIFGVMWWMG